MDIALCIVCLLGVVFIFWAWSQLLSKDDLIFLAWLFVLAFVFFLFEAIYVTGTWTWNDLTSFDLDISVIASITSFSYGQRPLRKLQLTKT